MDMPDKWVPVAGYEELYEVSDAGQVKSLKKNVVLSSHPRKGYPHVILYKDGKGKHLSVHRLVMKSFMGDSALPVDHINEDKADARLNNLRYVTHRENHIFYHENRGRVVGIRKRNNCNRWEASGFIKGTTVQLGMYATEEEAIAARKGFMLAVAAYEKPTISKIKGD